MGTEKLDNTVYYIRGLYDLASLAKSRHDGATFAWANNLARQISTRFDGAWWYAAASQYADSLTDPGNVQSFQKHWIGQTPMEAELQVNGRTVPGLAPYAHGSTALAGREDPCYSGTAPLSTGLFHTGCGGGANGQGEKVVFGLTTSIQSIGEGNYGRLGAGPAAALHPRPGRPDVRRARHRRDTRRAAGRDAGDLPLARPGREHRPVLDLSLDVHAGLGQLRHRLGSRAPVARHPARPRQRPAGRRPAGARWTAVGFRSAHPARWWVRRRGCLGDRLPLHDHRGVDRGSAPTRSGSGTPSRVAAR